MTLNVFGSSLHAKVYYSHDHRAYNPPFLRSSDVILNLLAKSRASATVFKPMALIQRIPRFLETYPDLRIVWLYRSYCDVVNSSTSQWSGMRDTLRQVVRDPRNSGWHGEDITAAQHAVLRQHYCEQMSLESAYELFWYLRNSFYFELSLANRPAVRIFRYEDLVTDPCSGFRQLFEFCGCPFDPSVTRGVFSTSIGKHPPPAIEPGIEEVCLKLSRRFDEVLAVGPDV